MSEEAAAAHAIVSGIKNWWHVITGCVLALWWTMVHVVRRLRDPVIRESRLEACRVSVVDCVEKHEREEIARYEQYRSEDRDAHAALNTKLDNLITVVIKHMDKD